MTDSVSIDISSRLLGKVVRGVDLPVIGTLNSIYRQHDLSEDEAEWRDNYHERVSEQGSMIPGGLNLSEGLRLQDALGDDRSPLPEQRADTLIEDNKEMQRGLSKKGIDQGSHPLVEDEIRDNILVSDQGHDLINGYGVSHSSGIEHERSIPIISPAPPLEEGEERGVAPFRIGDKVVDSERDIHIKDREIQDDPDGYITKNGSTQDRENRLKDASYQHLKASDFRSRERHINIRRSLLKPLILTHPTQQIEIQEKGAERLTEGDIMAQDIEIGADHRPSQEEDLMEEKGAVLPERERVQRVRDLMYEDHHTIKGQILKDDMPVDETKRGSIREVTASQKGGVKIGRIDIHIRGRARSEEDKEWPEPPAYTDHILTEDWEWSCLYRR